MNTLSAKPQLVVHIIYRLGIGGLENGLINLINNLPSDQFSHVIVSLKQTTDFKERLQNKSVKIYTLNKQEGQDWRSYRDLFRLLKKLRPDIVHTRNLATVEYQIPAFISGVKYRIHGEHGWDVFDPFGNNKKYQWLRRLIQPFINHFIPLSQHLEQYLLQKVHVPRHKITRICNGIDTEIFFPANDSHSIVSGWPFNSSNNNIYFGTVGRMHGVKDQITLVDAFIHILEKYPQLQNRLKLIVVGDGPLKAKAEQRLASNNFAKHAWLPGERDDISELMRCLDVFVLPSIAEGISNTILEAMASGLPIIATNVGGNPELVNDGYNGFLVPKSNVLEMADKMLFYSHHEQDIAVHGRHSRQLAVEKFSLQSMLSRYQTVYQKHDQG